MTTLVSVIHIVACFFLVVSVLIQAGKGAEISASLGGSSQTVFGSSGGATFLTRFTSIAAGIFMTTSIVLTLMGGAAKKSIFEGVPNTTAPAAKTNADAPAEKTDAAPAEQTK